MKGFKKYLIFVPAISVVSLAYYIINDGRKHSKSLNGGEPKTLTETRKVPGSAEIAKSQGGPVTGQGAGQTQAGRQAVGGGQVQATAPVGGTSATAPGSVAQTSPKPMPKSGCYKITYQHKPMESHNDGEACTQHKNLFLIHAENVAEKNVCVRVNGKPVKFKMAKTSSLKGEIATKEGYAVLFAPIAGPKSEVTATYCVGGTTCSESCKIEKDDFLAAIGAAEDDSDNLPVVQWDSKSNSKGQSKEEAALDKKLVEFKTVMSGSPTKEGLKIFVGWIEKGESQACQALGKNH